MTKDHGPSIKDDETYQALRDQGYDKAKAAAIANAQDNESMHPSEKGGKADAYENWTFDELYARAKELEVDGRSGMTKRRAHVGLARLRPGTERVIGAFKLLNFTEKGVVYYGY